MPEHRIIDLRDQTRLCLTNSERVRPTREQLHDAGRVDHVPAVTLAGYERMKREYAARLMAHVAHTRRMRARRRFVRETYGGRNEAVE